MRSISKISVVAAAAGLAIAPVAAQAGTRAASSPVTVDRGAAGTTDSNAIAGLNWAWVLLLLAAIAALIALVADGRTRGG